MTDRTAVPERVSRRAKTTTTRHGAGSGSQPVGDYVGQLAGEAAQAVRRAGLCPGLDRSFGCPAELIGLVVAQDPVAGSDLARNGMVTLYVAAPGGEPLKSDGDATPASSGQSDEALTGEVLVEEEPSTPPLPVTPVRARRRKPGHARHPIELAQTPPPPPTAIEPSPSEDAPAPPIAEPLEAWSAVIDAPEGALEDELADEQNERELPHEDFMVHVEDVLAGRSRLPGWRRRAYPRRRLSNAGRFRGWLREHRLLAIVMGLALGLWMILSVASTLDGHHPPLHASAVSPKQAQGAKRSGATPKSATAPKLSTHRTATRHAPPCPKRREQHAEPRRRVSTAPRPVRAASSAVSEAVALTPSQAPAPQPSRAPTVPRASTPPAPAVPEQSGGGPFSP